ncbi:dimethylaniline monooxygenase [Fomitiporia mediterranea MF3/22]|uniref:dimethylaniline monooxygenase n=1 Tax=Fomitiporia mediterranea (strain MF3/22) TaxID=694068 RepID=UPI0004408B80|nr:dimethylaniline monooxygenase [Fomitiporia mediterranea MF3/22]EJC98982.1 dimethylaniline monooxygenase [Fomitiporia mediterranea MF3/22]
MANPELQFASSWISAFGEAISQANIDAVLNCLDPSCWFRDLLVFNPSLETRHGHDAIRAHLQPVLGQAKVLNVVLDTNPHGRPQEAHFGPETPIITTAFDFETPRALGKGFTRLYYPKNGETPKALAVMMMVNDWKGHEEAGNESGVYDGHNLSWGEVYRQRREEVENDPQVVVVGGAQSGLQVAARFRQMGIRTLVIEQTARVGDVWRNRYPTLALHTPRSHHNLLYQPYPSNWPTFTPRDKLANWFEQYVDNQNLIVWTSTTLEPTPKYDFDRKRWTITVSRNGKPLTLHPQHLVMAISVYGDPIIPSLPGVSSFKGTILHSSAFSGGEPFKGQRVVVLGAGNTSADVCQDLVFRGAQSVTMVQRSATAVVSDTYLAASFGLAFPEGRPVYYSDLAFAGIPLGAMRELGKKLQSFAEEFDKEMHEGLTKAGFKLTSGPDGAGQLVMVFDRQGGYFIDVGCAALIINGKVKIRQGVEIDHLSEKSVVFNDGSKLDADAIILATGWHSVRNKLIRIFGHEVIDKTSELLGSDEHGEIRAGYKPSGQSGLWFAGSDFAVSRFYSKLLALQIKGIELGYLEN